jgi:DNA-binding IclR family transcriptional regulator
LKGRTSARSVEAMQAEVRRHGLGRGLGEETPNIAALAAPVFGANGRLALCLGVVSAIGFDTSYSGKPATALKRAAIDLSRRLGFSNGDHA